VAGGKPPVGYTQPVGDEPMIGDNAPVGDQGLSCDKAVGSDDVLECDARLFGQREAGRRQTSLIRTEASWAQRGRPGFECHFGGGIGVRG